VLLDNVLNNAATKGAGGKNRFEGLLASKIFNRRRNS
jgi:hypothetical protein